MKKSFLIMLATSALIPVSASASNQTHAIDHASVSDHVIKKQRSVLAKNTKGKVLVHSRHVISIQVLAIMNVHSIHHLLLQR